MLQLNNPKEWLLWLFFFMLIVITIISVVIDVVSRVWELDGNILIQYWSFLY